MDAALVSPGADSGRASRQRALEAIYATGHWLLGEDRVADAATVFRVLVRAAPRDGRAWLGLGQCHERIDQPLIALELYGAGGTVAACPARCLLARARLLASLGRQDEADEALERAEAAALLSTDDEVAALVAAEAARARAA